MMKGSHTSLVVFATILLTAASTILGLSWSRISQPQAPVDPATSALAWTLYRNDKYRFSLRIPRSWTIDTVSELPDRDGKRPTNVYTGQEEQGYFFWLAAGPADGRESPCSFSIIGSSPDYDGAEFDVAGFGLNLGALQTAEAQADPGSRVEEIPLGETGTGYLATVGDPTGGTSLYLYIDVPTQLGLQYRIFAMNFGLSSDCAASEKTSNFIISVASGWEFIQ